MGDQNRQDPGRKKKEEKRHQEQQQQTQEPGSSQPNAKPDPNKDRQGGQQRGHSA